VSLEADYRPLETLRPQQDQPFAVLVEIDQRKGRQQPLVILLQAAITHFRKSEDALQNAEGPLHFRAHSGLGAVLAPRHLIDAAFVFGTPRSHVLRCGSSGMNGLRLALVAGIAPDLLLGAV